MDEKLRETTNLGVEIMNSKRQVNASHVYGKLEPRDQVFSFLVVYCSLLLQKKIIVSRQFYS